MRGCYRKNICGVEMNVCSKTQEAGFGKNRDVKEKKMP